MRAQESPVVQQGMAGKQLLHKLYSASLGAGEGGRVVKRDGKGRREGSSVSGVAWRPLESH